MSISLPVVTYQCEPGCGACCKHLIIEIDALDIAREPKLKDACEHPFKHMPGADYDEVDEDTGENLGSIAPGWEAGGMLACGGSHPCKLLDTDQRCTIYPSRPNACVAFRAGSQSCRDVREAAGLAPLAPVAIGGLPT